jgi:hypothetical protein
MLLVEHLGQGAAGCIASPSVRMPLSQLRHERGKIRAVANDAERGVAIPILDSPEAALRG